MRMMSWIPAGSSRADQDMMMMDPDRFKVEGV